MFWCHVTEIIMVGFVINMSVMCMKGSSRKKKKEICRKHPSLCLDSFAETSAINPLFAAFCHIVKTSLMHGMCQRAGPSGWSRGRSCHCGDYGGLGGRELLPGRAAVCAEPRAGRSHSGPPPPASCWRGGRRLRSEGGSPPPGRWSEPAAAETAARPSWRPGLPERRGHCAGGAAGGCCGTATEPWGETDKQLSLLTLRLYWKITRVPPQCYNVTL